MCSSDLDRLSYGSAGNGNVSHLSVLLIAQATGFSAVHVPYKGVAPALADLIGGQVQFMTDTVNTSLAFIRDRRVRGLAVTSAKRVSTMPEVPTLAEVVPGYEPVPNWTGLFAPKGMAPALLARDPENRLLVRQSRFRIEAESVRDVMLQISGLLDETFGGPSVKPYQPDGYLAALNFPKRDWSASIGSDQYRRGLYTFWLCEI